MSSRNVIKVTDLDVRITELLDDYSRTIQEQIDRESEAAVDRLALITQETAPNGARGSFARHITSGLVKKTRFASIYAWYVKAPDYRLTHLLVHGHATKNGGRTRGNPFLKNALAEVLPHFESAVQSVLENAGK